jgi:hypothetical protein
MQETYVEHDSFVRTRNVSRCKPHDSKFKMQMREKGLLCQHLVKIKMITLVQWVKKKQPGFQKAGDHLMTTFNVARATLGI